MVVVALVAVAAAGDVVASFVGVVVEKRREIVGTV